MFISLEVSYGKVTGDLWIVGLSTFGEFSPEVPCIVFQLLIQASEA